MTLGALAYSSAADTLRCLRIDTGSGCALMGMLHLCKYDMCLLSRQSYLIWS